MEAGLEYSSETCSNYIEITNVASELNDAMLYSLHYTTDNRVCVNK